MRDAALTTGTWTANAKRLIDEDFGEGYAAAHPELVGAFIKAASTQFIAERIARAIEQLGSELADARREADG